MTRAQPTFHTPALEKLLSFSRKLKYITSIRPLTQILLIVV